MYAMVATRPDLAFPVSVLSKHMQNPRWCDCLKMKHILHYIKGTMDYKICYDGKSTSPDITGISHGFCDADWASYPETRRSFAGFFFLLANGEISWKTKQLTSATISSAESETIAIAFATFEAL
jgi:hypothetical protein